LAFLSTFDLRPLAFGLWPLAFGLWPFFRRSTFDVRSF
jgi:hypothetical protein